MVVNVCNLRMLCGNGLWVPDALVFCLLCGFGVRVNLVRFRCNIILRPSPSSLGLAQVTTCRVKSKLKCAENVHKVKGRLASAPPCSLQAAAQKPAAANQKSRSNSATSVNWKIELDLNWKIGRSVFRVCAGFRKVVFA